MDNHDTILENFISSLPSQLIKAYSVGALLYSPATNDFIYDKLISSAFGQQYSLALCLEDSVADEAVEVGEHNIQMLFSKINQNRHSFAYLPNLFIRVRSPEQMSRLYELLAESSHLLTGFILPKFSLDNGAQYIKQIIQINQTCEHKIYIMPILESKDIGPLSTRISLLTSLYDLLIEHQDYILNIRVGGNDLCHTLGIRRSIRQNIYQIRPVASILSDIITTFHDHFVISGPVWEYFSDSNSDWQTGLQLELQLDLLNGFIGKTVIHPNQIALVNDSLKVEYYDQADAIEILSFNHPLKQVAKSNDGSRMNEMKTHTNWAKKQLIRSYLYGVVANQTKINGGEYERLKR